MLRFTLRTLARSSLAKTQGDANRGPKQCHRDQHEGRKTIDGSRIARPPIDVFLKQDGPQASYQAVWQLMSGGYNLRVELWETCQNT